MTSVNPAKKRRQRRRRSKRKRKIRRLLDSEAEVVGLMTASRRGVAVPRGTLMVQAGGTQEMRSEKVRKVLRLSRKAFAKARKERYPLRFEIVGPKTEIIQEYHPVGRREDILALDVRPVRPVKVRRHRRRAKKYRRDRK